MTGWIIFAALAGLTLGVVIMCGLQFAPNDGEADLRAAAKAVSAIRPANWDDDEDPDQAAAWRELDAALGAGARP